MNARSICRIAVLALPGLLLVTDALATSGVIPLPPGGGAGATTVAPAVHPLPSSDPVAEERSVVVEGRANLNAGVEVARRQALLDAYRRAINVGGSMEVTEFSQVRNFRDVVDIVTKRSHGWIKQHEVLAEGPVSDNPALYRVAIRALVVDRLDGQRDDVLRQMVLMAGSPNVLFMLAEQDGSGNTVAASAEESVDVSIASDDIEVSVRRRGATGVAGGVEGVPDAPARSVEHLLAREFAEVGYQVMTSDDVSAVHGVSRDMIGRARRGDGADAARIGRLAGADVVVVGVVRYSVSAMSGGGTDLNPLMGAVGISARAVLPSSGKVLAVASTRQRRMVVRHADTFLAREESMARAAYIAAGELKWKIPQVLADEPRQIRITANAVAYDQAEAIRRYLAELSGIERVNMLGWKEGTAHYELLSIFTGPTEDEVYRAMKTRFSSARMLEIENFRLVLTFN